MRLCWLPQRELFQPTPITMSIIKAWRSLHKKMARPDVVLAYYPIWGRFTNLTARARPIVASSAAREAKRRALACHRSQMTPLIDDDPEGFVMEAWRQEHFLMHPEIIIAA
jgi:hypothetical protein